MGGCGIHRWWFREGVFSGSRGLWKEEEDEKDKRIGGARARAGDVSGREGGWYETVGFGRGDGSTTQVYNVLFVAPDHGYSYLHPLARGKPQNLLRGNIIMKPVQTASWPGRLEDSAWSQPLKTLKVQLDRSKQGDLPGPLQTWDIYIYIYIYSVYLNK
jgi:hypothetical protein